MQEQELQQHKKFLAEAVRLAQENVGTGRGGPFGAVIVKDGKIIARGVNQVLSTKDPTMHAEVSAIRAACEQLNSFELEDCIIYSSCEPCPMCLGAIYWARPKALFFAADQYTAAKHGFDDKFIYDEIAVPVGERKIKTVCLKLQEQEEPFKEWTAKEDKIQY